MQSGRARTHDWVLDLVAARVPQAEPVMGWIGAVQAGLTKPLEFASLEAALAYARDQGIETTVEPVEATSAPRPKAYADNFSPRRRDNWTH